MDDPRSPFEVLYEAEQEAREAYRRISDERALLARKLDRLTAQQDEAWDAMQKAISARTRAQRDA